MKFLRRNWRGLHGLVMWKKWEIKNEQMPRKWRGYGGEEDDNCDGGLH